MCATLFLTYADVEMSKVVTSLMSKDKLDMGELRAQIRSLESSPWYKGGKESVKMSSAQGGAPSAPQGEDGAQLVTDQPTIPKIAGGSVNGAEARVTRLKNADLEKMLRQRRLI